MKEPNITSEVGGYELAWPDGLHVRIQRLAVHSRDGSVTGKLGIKNVNGSGEVTLLPSSSFNFSSEVTRNRTAKGLSQKYGEGRNWQELFDYLAEKVQALALSGDEVAEIWLEDDVKAPELLLPPFIYRGVPNIMFGEKGVNKSTLAYVFAVCLSIPWDENPLDLCPMGPIKTLVMDWETDQSVFKWYMSRLKRGMQIPPANIFYRRYHVPLAENLDQIESDIKQTGAQVLIIDSLAAAAGGDSSDLKGSSQALQFNSALRKLKTTSFIIAQTSKDYEGKHKTIYGSTLFTYYARNIFELCRPKEDSDPNSLHLAVFHRENNFGPKVKPMGICVTYDDNDGISLKREPISVAEFAEKMSAGNRIVDLLKGGALTIKEITETLDLNRNTVQVAINRLKRNRKVVKVGDTWGLATF